MIVDPLIGLDVKTMVPSAATEVIIAQIKEGLEGVKASLNQLDIEMFHWGLYVLPKHKDGGKPSWIFYVRVGKGSKIDDRCVSPDPWCQGLEPNIFAGAGEGILISFETEGVRYEPISWRRQACRGNVRSKRKKVPKGRR